MIKEWITRNLRLIILLLIVVAIIYFVNQMKNIIFNSATYQIEQVQEVAKTQWKKVTNHILTR